MIVSHTNIGLMPWYSHAGLLASWEFSSCMYYLHAYRHVPDYTGWLAPPCLAANMPFWVSG